MRLAVLFLVLACDEEGSGRRARANFDCHCAYVNYAYYGTDDFDLCLPHGYSANGAEGEAVSWCLDDENDLSGVECACECDRAGGC
jgi:hypothetical protein